MTAPLTRFALIAPLLAMAACAQIPAAEPVTAAPTPPPAAAAVPPAEPAATRSVEGMRALPIFFEPWSASLGEAAETALREASDLARAHPEVRILVVGYADPRGSREANVILSRLRARVVSDFLVENGVAQNRLRIQYTGPVAGMEGIQSRRVEVRVDRGQQQPRQRTRPAAR
ncbi:OmpA family protein [Roseococcus pinisoli]|uniref:OmpA family protein n=1 Tax=Roseococcus pinisoli TaxID=2835040 RepID=A0ABS5QI74_9PROT|nr:OmpA family protein [Roseococcus pinisoli]